MSGKRSYEVANRIFGFNGWKTEITQSRIETAEETLDGKFIVFVETTVRVTLKDGTYCEVAGYGKAYDVRAKHVALGKAKKHALTDAKKRALQRFGILDQLFSVNNETYKFAELKNDSLHLLSTPNNNILSKKTKSSLFKRSGKLDLQKTTYNAGKNIVFIKHKPISELTLADPTKSYQHISKFTPTAGSNTLLHKQESKTLILNKNESKELSIKNNNNKAEDLNHQNLPPASDKKEVQIPIIPALSLQDSFSFDGDNELFAELIKKEEKEEESLMDEIDDDFLGNISTQALIGNR